MIPGFGKQTIVLGSAPSCDIVLNGPGVAPAHARIVHSGGGQLLLLDAGAGPTTANGQPVPPGGQVPFDFRTTFALGSVAVPLNHPAIILMLMARGSNPAPPGQLVIGREPSRATLVIHHPSVSSQHATVMLDRMMVIDHQSTSGTWVGPNRIPPSAPTAIDPNGVVAFGPVPVPVSLLIQLGQAFNGAPIAVPPTAGNAPLPQQPPSAQMGAPGSYGAAPAPSDQSRFKKSQTVVGQLGMGSDKKEYINIGRTPDNDIQVQHPQVSSKHAALRKIQGQFFLEDLRSANGTFVRGQRLVPGSPVPVSNGEKVFIGPQPLVIQFSDGGAEVVREEAQNALQQHWTGPLFEVEAWSLTVEVSDRDNPGYMRKLLTEVSFKALPGDMIALMGPSGAGKTTLLMTLNGYKPPTSGQVRVNGEDLYAIYDALRGSIGYVPQDDIVHPELTVFEAVKYSARFRLPPDYSDDEINQRVMATLSALGLADLANLEIGKPEKKVLSGGQRKRVNIALELVTDPVILFLDEPTSGLAADDTTQLITVLSDLARRTGKTIITTIHQPAKEEFEKFNLALIMGYGGVPIFYGPTRGDSYRFFGHWKELIGQQNNIDNPRDMFDMIREREKAVFDQMRAQNPQIPKVEARKAAVAAWQQEFQASTTFQKMYSNERAIGQQPVNAGVNVRGASTSGQLRLLLSRYAKVKRRDVGGTAIMLLQAPIIGVLLAFVFGGQKDAKPFWCLGAIQELAAKYGQPPSAPPILKDTSDHTAAIFFLVIAAVWFGTSNAAREIVSERAIYMRERMVNLGLINYMLSKFMLLCFICVVQCTVLLGIVFFALGLHGGMQAFGIELATLCAVSWCSVSLGLMISTSVESSEAAMALTPIALIPQVVLAGLIVPMTTNSMLKWAMFVIPARWGFQGTAAQERLAIADDPAWILDSKPGTNLPEDFITNGKFYCAKAQLAHESLSGAWGFAQYDQVWLPFAVLGAMTLSMLIMLLFLLRRRDPI
jgi:ABC transport system ATP-binding/permease protein